MSRAPLSLNAFVAAIEQLATTSRALNEPNPWTVESENGVTFVVKRNDLRERRVEVVDNGDEHYDVGDDDVAELVDDDLSTLPTDVAAASQMLVYEWHVCYSASYQAPAIYFRVFELGAVANRVGVIC